jgi:tetratricopeptide (TPR) repeat protein
VLESDRPYLITPRNGEWVRPQFLIQWHPIAPEVESEVESGIELGVEYTIHLYRLPLDESEPKALIWQITTPEHQVTYPGTPPLEPGWQYAVEVTPVLKAPSAEVSGDRGQGRDGRLDRGLDRGTPLDNPEADSPENYFWAAFPETVTDLEEQGAVLAAQGLSAEGQAIGLASLYFGQGFYGEALGILQPFVRDMNDNPMIYLMLADIYGALGLYGEFANHYEQVLALGIAQENQAVQAAARHHLALGAMNQGDWARAKDLLEQALTNYQTVGDELKAQEVQGRLNNISTLLDSP